MMVPSVSPTPFPSSALRARRGGVLGAALSLLAALAVPAAAQNDPFYPTPAGLDTARLVMPKNLVYQGAFRLDKARGTTQYGLTYLVGAMAYNSNGDFGGPQDGYPGSLFIGGHSSERQVAEVNIPAPLKSRTYDALPKAAIISPFRRIAGEPSTKSGIWAMDFELTADKGYPGSTTFHVTYADGYLPPAGQPTYSTARLDFSGQTSKRVFGPDNQHCYNEYAFSVPESWSAVWAPGKRLAVGRHREGDLCGQGPALFLTDPWNTTGTVNTVTALRYKQRDGALRSYSHGGDVYYAGQWLEAGRKSAVIFAGRKGLGKGAYGTYCGTQGFHDLQGYKPYLIFYDPVDLGKVVSGQIQSHVPQPYAAIDLSSLLLYPNTDACKRYHLNDFAFDAARRVLYATEKSKGEYPVVHVWKIGG